MGARPLLRAIQRLIEDPLADFILGRELSEGSTIIVDRREDPGPDDPKVEMRIIEGEVQPEPVTVPADEPATAARTRRMSERPASAGRT